MSRKRLCTLIGVCLFLFCVDVLVKWYTCRYISPVRWGATIYPYGGIPVFQDLFGVDFSLNYVTNKGAAWGVFAHAQSYLLGLRLLLVGGLAVYLCKAPMDGIVKVALSLVLTGAIGNILDFFLYEHVIDMFHFVFWGYSFPVFNVADVLIFCGVMLFLFRKFCDKKR